LQTPLRLSHLIFKQHTSSRQVLLLLGLDLISDELLVLDELLLGLRDPLRLVLDKDRDEELAADDQVLDHYYDHEFREVAIGGVYYVGESV
jgi:hypothetical protein